MEELKAAEFSNSVLNWAGEVGQLAEIKGLEIIEVTEGGRDLIGESVGEHVERDDAVRFGTAFHASPRAAVGGWIP